MKNVNIIEAIKKIQEIKQEKMAILIAAVEAIKKISEKIEFKKILKMLFLFLGAPLVLSGCIGMNSKFDCNVSSDGKCASMGTIHKMADIGEFNEYPKHKIIENSNIIKASGSNRSNIGTSNSNNINSKYPYLGQKYYPNTFSTFPTGHPLRTSETIQKIWIGPYEDDNGNYHEPSYVYAVIKKAKWLAESE